MKYLVFALLMCLAIPSWACTVEVPSSSPELQAQADALMRSCQETLNAKKPESANLLPTKETLTAFGGVAKDVAFAIGIAARELGMATNEFLATPAGMLVALLIIWKVFGVQMIGLAMIAIIITIGLWVVRRVLIESRDTIEVRGLFGTQKSKVVPVYRDMRDINDTVGIILLVVLGSVVVLTTAIIMNMVA